MSYLQPARYADWAEAGWGMVIDSGWWGRACYFSSKRCQPPSSAAADQ